MADQATATAEVIEGEAVEEVGEVHSQAVVPAPAAPTLAVAPQVKPAELVERLTSIRETQAKAMLEGVDYGAIPGTDKPTLLKPGAEKLGVLFQLDVQLRNEKTWGPGDHLTVISHATVFHAPTGARLGYGEGVCTTRERKYAYRQAQRTCPACGATAVIKGKAEYGGGWLCWRKRDGCGATFAEDDQAITGQEAGEVENPDLPDLWNTVVKMAEKRARVDAVLAVTGASALFTQDIEDDPNGAAAAGPPAKPARAKRNGKGKSASGTVARPQAQQAPKASASTSKDGGAALATQAQRRLIFAKFKEAGGEAEDELRAIMQWAAGTAHSDKVPKAKVDELLATISDREGTLAAIHDAAGDAERPDGPEAREIVDRYLRPAGEQPELG